MGEGEKVGNGSVLFLTGTELQFYKIKTIMEMDGNDGCTFSMFLIPLNYTLKNDSILLCVLYHNKIYFKKPKGHNLKIHRRQS